MNDVPREASPLNVTLENFESVVDSNPFVVLDFWAPWCGPCRIFSPIFDAVAVAHPDVCFGKVNTEEASDLASAFQVRSIPTVMAFRNAELVFERAGLLPAEEFESLLRGLKSGSPVDPA